MKISKIKVSNILGITELAFEAGEFTEITGRNGEGKTSVLEAIKAALSSGHDATLLRNGATKGEVVLVLDDGTELSKAVTASGSTTTVRRDGKKLLRPAEVIRQMADMMSVNPIEFLLAKKADRTRALLEAMPMTVDAPRLSEISGIQVAPSPGVHALHVIERVHTTVYDARTGTNRAIKEKEATIRQLEQAIPPAPAGAGGDESELTAKVAELRAALDTRLSSIANRLAEIEQNSAKINASINADLQSRIAELKAEAQTKIDNEKSTLAGRQSAAAAAREKAKDEHASASGPINSQLAIIRADREAVGRRTQTLETIGILKGELESLTDEAARQNEALAAIDQYKAELLSSLPIRGLEVVGGEVLRDGVPFDRLNTAQQVDVSVELAKLRAGALGVICVDRIECLDHDTLDAFRKSALDSGLQMFVTRVSDEPFSISSTDQ